MIFVISFFDCAMSMFFSVKIGVEGVGTSIAGSKPFLAASFSQTYAKWGSGSKPNAGSYSLLSCTGNRVDIVGRS